MLARALAALIALLAALPSFATPQARNATDMWFNAAESGWGLNLVHQGDTLFGTLYVYDANGLPAWYVAPNLVGDGVYSGPLFAATGPWFGAGSFNPGSVTRRQVGTMLVDTRNDPATLDYTVDGVHVTKQVTRFTFRAVNLNGLHRALVYRPAGNGAAEVKRDLEQFHVEDIDGMRVSIATSSDAEIPCLYTGSRAQDGPVESVSGSVECGPRLGGASGNWSMRVDPTPNGFVGSFSDALTRPAGRIAAALAGPSKMEGMGWRNGMWYIPGENGWGVNIIEEGDTIFATLFVYDPQGRPKWYVASQLTQSGTTSDGTAINSGELYEATGPYFGASSFNPAAVTRRRVGTMSFQVRAPGSAALTYTVDGVSVTKAVTPFAFATNDPSGTYQGQISELAAGAHDPAVITIDARGGAFSMQIKGMYGGTCNYTGASMQIGHFINASGTVNCGTGSSANFRMSNLTVEGDGVTGLMELSDVTGFVQDGERTFHFAGARS